VSNQIFNIIYLWHFICYSSEREDFKNFCNRGRRKKQTSRKLGTKTTKKLQKKIIR